MAARIVEPSGVKTSISGTAPTLAVARQVAPVPADATSNRATAPLLPGVGPSKETASVFPERAMELPLPRLMVAPPPGIWTRDLPNENARAPVLAFSASTPLGPSTKSRLRAASCRIDSALPAAPPVRPVLVTENCTEPVKRPDIRSSRFNQGFKSTFSERLTSPESAKNL